jgi:nucleotide-binding universal stress UspA family protein
MFERCLICTDFTDSLQRLVDFVPSLGKSGLREIVFFHNVPLWEEGEIPRVDTEKVEEAIGRLETAKNSAKEGVEVKIEVTSGRLVDNMIQTANKYQSEVIIVGTSIKNLVEEKIFGSTTLALTKITSIPVMILRPQLISTYTVEELSLRCQHLWRYFLIPYNDEKNDHYLIEKIKEYLTKNQAKCLKKCLSLSIINDTSNRGNPLEYRLKEAEKKLAQVKSELELLGLEVETEVREGNPLHEVLNAALIHDISCVAIAFNSHNLLQSVVGNLGTEILKNSWFPVLFFPVKK